MFIRRLYSFLAMCIERLRGAALWVLVGGRTRARSAWVVDGRCYQRDSSDVGRDLSCVCYRTVCAKRCLCSRLRQTVRKEPEMWEPLLGLVVAVGLGIYLLVTLVYPERF
jgi:K+-transporting ATPase KdpF subunit